MRDACVKVVLNLNLAASFVSEKDFLAYIAYKYNYVTHNQQYRPLASP